MMKHRDWSSGDACNSHLPRHIHYDGASRKAYLDEGPVSVLATFKPPAQTQQSNYKIKLCTC